MAPGLDRAINDLPEAVNDEKNWDLDGAIGGESVLGFDAKRRLQGIKVECRTKNEKDSRSVTFAVRITHELLSW